MSLLVLQLPPRRRLGSRAGEGDVGTGAPGEFDFVLSLDGSGVSQTGCAPTALLPPADRTVLVLADADVAWHRIEIPKAPPAKMRAALTGVMEEALLDDEDALHFALGPGAQPGHSGWVAVTHRAWLSAVLGALESAGREVTQVVPASRPRDPASGHFFTAGPAAVPCLVLERPDGVTCVNLEGALARVILFVSEASLRAAVARTAERATGLAELLW